MHQLLYISRMTRPLSKSELGEIHRRSRERNQAAQLSGALVAWNGCFLQILEGRQSALSETMARIGADARHTDVRRILSGPIPARRFEDWAMELVNFDDPSPRVREVMDRHPPLSLAARYYRDPFLAFALVYDVRHFLWKTARPGRQR